MTPTKELEKKGFEALKESRGFTNVMQSPRIQKVTISTGVGKIKSDKNKLKVIQDRLTKISGQKPSVAAAKKSIATFKTREGDIAGYKITLHGDRMYQFIDKLVNVAIPRTKDFRGINRTVVDEMGNMTIGIKEHIIFPETSDEELRDIFGLAVTITTSSDNRDDAFAFFEHIGIPFKKEEVANEA